MKLTVFHNGVMIFGWYMYFFSYSVFTIHIYHIKYYGFFFIIIRPDYKQLGVFKENFQNVPIMALTATATQRVRQDILHQLNTKDTKWYTFDLFKNIILKLYNLLTFFLKFFNNYSLYHLFVLLI